MQGLPIRAAERDDGPERDTASGVSRDANERSCQCLHHVLTSRSGQGGDVGRSAISHPCEHMRSRARSSNPLARAFLDLAGRELRATTLLRTGAHIQYRRRYRSAFGQRAPRTVAPPPYVVDEAPDAMLPLTRWLWNTAHRDYHRSHDSETWEVSPALDRESVQTNNSATRPSSPEGVFAEQLLSGNPRSWFTQPVESWRHLWRNDATVTGRSMHHAADEKRKRRNVRSCRPHSTPYATEPPDEHVPHHAALGHATITAETSPTPTAPVGLEMSGDQSSGYPQSKASTSTHSKPSRTGTGYPCGTSTNHFKTTPTKTRTNRPQMTPRRLRVPSSKNSLGTFTCSAPIRPMIYILLPPTMIFATEKPIPRHLRISALAD